MKLFRWPLFLTSAVACVLLSAPAYAEDFSLGALYKTCTSSAADDKTACRFYIYGVFEGAKLVGASVQTADGKMQEATEKRFCVPDEMTSEAMELLIKRNMGADLAVYPDDGRMPAVSFISSVIQVSFPCKNKK